MLSKNLMKKDGSWMSKEKDRIAKYLIPLNKRILFDELSEDYLNRAGVSDILKGVPVPIAAGMGGDEITTLTLALGMARIIGADNDFKYRDLYLEYFTRIFGSDFVKILVSEGAKLAMSGDYEVAAMLFRAALIIDPRDLNALYLYGRTCKDAYEIETDDEGYVGSYKAESTDAFEVLTILHPDFAMGYYFLGYAYANLGLYKKAELTWLDFMRLSEGNTDEFADTREEISERLEQLADPVIIEDACNRIVSGDYVAGKEVLSRYRDTDFSNWWPLWYYLGLAESGLGNAEDAAADYVMALRFNPGSTAVMKELVEIYRAIGDEEAVEKYSNKIEMVLSNIREEREEEV